VDPYEEALCLVGLADGSKDAFFWVDSHGGRSNVPWDVVCFHYPKFNFIFNSLQCFSFPICNIMDLRMMSVDCVFLFGV
jgi:hypothetical protein